MHPLSVKMRLYQVTSLTTLFITYVPQIQKIGNVLWTYCVKTFISQHQSLVITTMFQSIHANDTQ